MSFYYLHAHVWPHCCNCQNFKEMIPSSRFFFPPIILLENCLFLTWFSCGPVSMATLRSAGTRVLIFFLAALFGSHQSVCHQAPSLSANESSLKSLSAVLLSCCWKPREIQLQQHAAVERSVISQTATQRPESESESFVSSNWHVVVGNLPQRYKSN